MLTTSYIIAILFEIILPIGVAIWLTRRFKTGWRLVGVGVLTFIASQVVHIPLLMGITYGLKASGLPLPADKWLPLINGVILGLLAGLCEEFARYIAFRILKDRAPSAGSALTLGIGHGGVESLFVGLTVLANFVTLSLVQKTGLQIPGLTADQVAAFWSTAWYLPLLGAFERLAAVVLQLSLTLLVWRAVRVRRSGWLWLAILWHAVVDGLAVAFQQVGWSPVALEGLIAVLALVTLAAVIVLGRRWQAEVPAQVDVPAPAV